MLQIEPGDQGYLEQESKHNISRRQFDIILEQYVANTSQVYEPTMRTSVRAMAYGRRSDEYLRPSTEASTLISWQPLTRNADVETDLSS